MTKFEGGPFDLGAQSRVGGYHSAAALLAMQSAVIPRAIPSVRPSVHPSVRLSHAGTHPDE